MTSSSLEELEAISVLPRRENEHRMIMAAQRSTPGITPLLSARGGHSRPGYASSDLSGFEGCPGSNTISQDRTAGEKARKSALLADLGKKRQAILLKAEGVPLRSLGQAPEKPFACDQCDNKFDELHKLNHHKRYHERPHKCPQPGCNHTFGTKTHLDRHFNDKHHKVRKFYCTERDCPYSVQGGKSFSRKDIWRQHILDEHQVAPKTRKDAAAENNNEAMWEELPHSIDQRSEYRQQYTNSNPPERLGEPPAAPPKGGIPVDYQSGISGDQRFTLYYDEYESEDDLVHYVCPFCPAPGPKCSRPDNLERHVRKHHADKEKDHPLLRQALSTQSSRPKTVRYKVNGDKTSKEFLEYLYGDSPNSATRYMATKQLPNPAEALEPHSTSKPYAGALPRVKEAKAYGPDDISYTHY
ncbi:hypothetical protein N656DRAFT_71373 [Canariomyces notabilis]|uniref:C2H2-type domain-containing protein n=1 Tax=Canariomyces notabilis TaxID=2074819 RepID=A0AAN6YSZ6_9PEZI|nr:hypothetical protein N656DRAFT_71373 [Canariomyces arenarius]